MAKKVTPKNPEGTAKAKKDDAKATERKSQVSYRGRKTGRKSGGASYRG
jgi:hypothetical protein